MKSSHQDQKKTIVGKTVFERRERAQSSSRDHFTQSKQRARVEFLTLMKMTAMNEDDDDVVGVGRSKEQE